MAHPIRILSRVQRNEIFDAIRRANLDPADFRWTATGEDEDDATETLSHAGTGGFAEFSQTDGVFWLRWWPTNQQGALFVRFELWLDVIAAVQSWVIAVLRDHHAPDLWGEIAKTRAIPSAADSPEYRQKFSADELKSLDMALADIERYIVTTQPLDSAGKEQVSRRFAYLRDAARQGIRKRWLFI